MTIKAIVLDAMGVIYPVGDDLRVLLMPFLTSRGCTLSDDEIIALYRACYRDGLAAAAFWEAVACDGRVEDLEADVLRLYELQEGVLSFLEAMRNQGLPVYGLSNDVAEWSLRRRQHFNIEHYFQGWVVSGESGLYKPDPRIYQLLLDKLPCAAHEALFVDDSLRNLEAAAALGLQTAHFSDGPPEAEPAVTSFADLESLVCRLL